MVYLTTDQTSGLASYDTIDWVGILFMIQMQECLQNKSY